MSDKARVLFFDGHESYLSIELVEEAKKKNSVILLCLPAHMTHLLQPLDRTIFRPVKLKRQAMLVKFARMHNGPFGKKDTNVLPNVKVKDTSQ